jgi:hypothetical protein
VTGDIGTSPIALTAITGFGLVLDLLGTFSTSSMVTGKVYGASLLAPTPAYLTTSVGDMMAAYTDAQGRANPDEINFTGYTFAPGLYKWTVGLTIPTNTELKFIGSATDVWIMQIAGIFTFNAYSTMVLEGGAQAGNIFWTSSTGTTIGTYAHVEGIILAGSAITLATGSSLNGAAFAQTAVTLDAVNVVKRSF